MFLLKNKSEQFRAFKAYKVWAEHHTDRQLKCIWTDWGGEFLSNEQKEFTEESGIEHQTQQNGRAEWFQQTIINKAESMCHMAGLSSGFWSYCQIGIEITDYTGDKISVGVARPSHVDRTISTMWRMMQHPRNKGTTHVHRIRDKGTGFDHKGHYLITADGWHRYPQHPADALTNAQQVQLIDNAMCIS